MSLLCRVVYWGFPAPEAKLCVDAMFMLHHAPLNSTSYVSASEATVPKLGFKPKTLNPETRQPRNPPTPKPEILNPELILISKGSKAL